MFLKERRVNLGQKVNPVGFRTGIYRNWDTHWFATKEYSKFLCEDIKIREVLMSQLPNAAVSKIVIERTAGIMTINIYTARPGIVIGRKGTNINVLKSSMEKITDHQISINIIEVKKPELDARLVAEGVAQQIEGQISYRRAMKKSIFLTMRVGAKGIKISCSGRLGGAEMARTVWFKEGRIPLHTLKADIDYGQVDANTKFGVIGVKVWINRGESTSKEESVVSSSEQAELKKESQK